MSVYSVENIEQIITRLFRKEGMSLIVPEDFKSQKENIKFHKDSKKEYVKRLRQLRRELSKLNEYETLNFEEKKETTKEILKKIEELDIKIKEKSFATEEGEKKWKESIRKYAKELLINIQGKKIIPKIEDFVLFDKTTFKTGDFTSKILEQLIKEDIAKHYKKKPADRNSIIEQLTVLLGNKLPKCIIRADIKSFFESVPMDKLVKKIEEEGYVSPTTISYLRRISNYVKDKGVDGVPRGLAFSSYLTEIYMQRIDDEIRNLPNIYFYQRYVDDIVLLFSINSSIHSRCRPNEGRRQWNIIKGLFRQEDLSLHEEGKKKCIIYSGKTTQNQFDYLGYKFIINEGKLTIRLSDNRLDGYVKKIEAIFNHYNSTARDNQSLTNGSVENGEKRRKRQQPLKRLFGQLSALTGNGILKGPKSNILTGIYYSNIFITSLDDFKLLDSLLKHYIIDHLEIPDNLFKYDGESCSEDTKKKIKEMMIDKWSFEYGFMNRRFCKNTSYFNRLKQIKNLCQ